MGILIVLSFFFGAVFFIFGLVSFIFFKEIFFDLENDTSKRILKNVFEEFIRQYSR